MPSKVTLGGELLYPSKYLTAEDLKGKDTTVTIAKVLREDLMVKGGKPKKSVTVYFEKATKALVCNVTNADSIAHLHGKRAEDWVGKQITLYPTKTTFGREPVSCVRVREKSPRPSQQAEPPQEFGESEPAPTYDDIPFDQEQTA
jgi:hypothetical protein